MKKDFLYLLIFLLCSMSFLTSVFAGPNEEAGIRFDLDAATAGNQNLTHIDSQPAGAMIRVDVYATNVYNLDTYEFEILYDSKTLKYVGCSATNPLTYEENILTSEGGTAIGWMVDDSPGVLSIAYTLANVDTLEAPEGEGLIADVVFEVLSEVKDTLKFGETKYYDTFGEVDIVTDKDVAIIEAPEKEAGIRFDLDATTYGNQNLTTVITPTVGEYLRVDCYAINVYNLDTYEFEILYDSKTLKYVGSSATNPLTYEENILTSEGGTAIGWMVDDSPGVLSIAYTLAGEDTTQAPEGEGLIADVVFQVLKEIGDTLRFGRTRYFDTFGEVDIITDKDEAIIEGLVSVDEEEIHFEESMLSHYPNPVQNRAIIKYGIKDMLRTEAVDIGIYNAKGQLIDTIHGKNGTAIWNTNKHPNGIYFYKINNKKNEIVRKIILMK